MITTCVPKFVQERFVDEKNGTVISYNLFCPASDSSGTRKPLVLFMEDSSTPSKDVSRPLLQG